jgi:hypothetical protein
MSPSSHESTVALERALLRALCDGTTPAAARDRAKQELENYTWQEEEHKIVYQTLRKARANGAVSLRTELPAHATRLGFPDVDWQSYFAGPREARHHDVDRLIGELKLRKE